MRSAIFKCVILHQFVVLAAVVVDAPDVGLDVAVAAGIIDGACGVEAVA